MKNRILKAITWTSVGVFLGSGAYYIWRGKYWELKSTTTPKAANSAIRKAIKQIERNPGGIILNYDAEIDVQETVSVIEKRMKGSKQGDISVDVMIIKNGN